MENPSRAEFYSELPLPEAAPPPIVHTPDNPPWGVFPALGVWLVSVLAIILLPTIFLLPYLLQSAPNLLGSPDLVEFARSDATAVLLQVIAIIPAHVLTILLAYLVVTRFRRHSFTEMLGWQSAGFRWWHYVAILVGFMGVASLVGHYVPEQENDLIRILRSSRMAVYVVAFMATFTAPLVEEVVYRGVLYSAFQRSVGMPAAFVVVTLLFAIVHVPQYYPSYSTILLLTLLSVILTLMRAMSGNLLPSIILHTIFNGVQSLLLIVQPMLVETQPPDPAAFW
jgi:uncharacterized protein